MNVLSVLQCTECDRSSFARNSVGLDFARFPRPRIGRRNIAALPCLLRATGGHNRGFIVLVQYDSTLPDVQHVARPATRLYYRIIVDCGHDKPARPAK